MGKGQWKTLSEFSGKNTGESLRTDRNKIIEYLNSALHLENSEEIRQRILELRLNLSFQSGDLHAESVNIENGKLELRNLIRDLDQIADSYTAERMKYYIRRLIRSLDEVRPGRINDINLNRWKDYEDILTDSLWIFDKRDSSGEHLGWYWGNFIPQIPNQLILRYSKSGDWVFDPFAGSGTTLIECRRLGRNGIGIELNGDVAIKARERIEMERNERNVTTDLVTGDSTGLDFKSLISKEGIENVNLVIMHPPYHNIIKFSGNDKDLSNTPSVDLFIRELGKIAGKCADILEKDRYLALVIGDKYESGQWIPLGFYSMQEILNLGLKLKSIVVKNFDYTRGKRSQQELWRYRALQGGYYVFKHEYIFIFKKS
ncbi:MAG: DNA methyltransferase [Thermoplasmatales archaeon]